MASISYTAADVLPLHPSCIIRRFTAAATLTPGDAVYIDSSGTINLADSDAEATSRVIGIVVGGAYGSGGVGATSFASGQVVDVCVRGPVGGFSGMTPGAEVWASTTPGDLEDTKPAGASGDFPYVIGISETASIIDVNPGLDLLVAA